MPYNPSDPVLGTDMTQGEWDQLRELMRKAEAGGKMNELLTVHKRGQERTYEQIISTR